MILLAHRLAALRRSGWVCIALLAACGSPGCQAPFVAQQHGTEFNAPVRGSGPDLSGSVTVDSPRAHPDPELLSPPYTTETWLVHNRACEEVIGSNPWPSLVVGRP